MIKEILSPGKKIKKIRKEFKIKQHEITGGEITRELISIIENDKSRLRPNVAEIIAENINKLCKERNIDFHITASYLVEDVNFQANKIADEYIEYLKTIEGVDSKYLMEIVEEIEAFLMQYDVCEKKTIIYEEIGDLLKHKKKYNKSYTYYIKAFENHNGLFNDLRLVTLLLKTGSLCILLTRYSDALDFNSLALNYNINIPEDIKYKLLFNTALAYKKLSEYDNSIKEIEHIETTLKNLTKQDIFDLTVLKANTFRAKNLYADALQLNEILLDSMDITCHENIILLTSNIIDIYTVLKDSKNIKIYIDKLIYYINNFEDISENVYLCGICNQIGESSMLIGAMDQAKKYYSRSIKACKHHRNKEVLEESLNALLAIHIEENDLLQINKFKNELLELMKLDAILPNTIILFKLINYYNTIGETETISNLLEFTLNFTLAN